MDGGWKVVIVAFSVGWVIAALKQWQKERNWKFQGFYQFFWTVVVGVRAEQIRRKFPPPPLPT